MNIFLIFIRVVTRKNRNEKLTNIINNIIVSNYTHNHIEIFHDLYLIKTDANKGSLYHLIIETIKNINPRFINKNLQIIIKEKDINYWEEYNNK